MPSSFFCSLTAGDLPRNIQFAGYVVLPKTSFVDLSPQLLEVQSPCWDDSLCCSPDDSFSLLSGSFSSNHTCVRFG